MALLKYTGYHPCDPYNLLAFATGTQARIEKDRGGAGLRVKLIFLQEIQVTIMACLESGTQVVYEMKPPHGVSDNFPVVSWRQVPK